MFLLAGLLRTLHVARALAGFYWGGGRKNKSQKDLGCGLATVVTTSLCTCFCDMEHHQQYDYHGQTTGCMSFTGFMVLSTEQNLTRNTQPLKPRTSNPQPSNPPARRHPDSHPQALEICNILKALVPSSLRPLKSKILATHKPSSPKPAILKALTPSNPITNHQAPTSLYKPRNLKR